VKTSKAGAALFVVCSLLGGMIAGCRDDGPLGVQSYPVLTQEPDFIKLPRNLSLQKVIADTAMITPEKGGDLKLQFRYKYIAGTGKEQEFNVNMKLKFGKGAVTDTLVASLIVDDQVLRSNLDITFNPHGASFLKPAVLDVEVKGVDVDVAGLKPEDTVWLYYDDNGTWTQMVAKKVDFKYDQGMIKCANAELPHFSRYAFVRWAN
jgi:hypothetical protein